MMEYAEIFAHDLTTEVFLLSTAAMMIAAAAAGYWICRPRNRTATKPQRQPSMARLAPRRSF
jgi:hypothetical protein